MLKCHNAIGFITLLIIRIYYTYTKVFHCTERSIQAFTTLMSYNFPLEAGINLKFSLMFPTVVELKQQDAEKRNRRWFHVLLIVNPEILFTTLCTYESWFHLSGYSNTSISIYWEAENQYTSIHKIVERISNFIVKC